MTSLQIINSEELRIQLPIIRDSFRASARSMKSFRGAFREVGREIDRRIKDAFKATEWEPLSPRTEHARFKESGYYGEVVPRQDKIGRWSDDMYQGLLGGGVLGDTFTDDKEYHRSYRDHGVRAQRVIWFHEGTKSQPPRPFWRENERSEVAKKVIRDYVTARVTNRFQ